MKTFNRNRNLILLALDWTRPKDPPLSLGHASIYTNLKLNGVNVKEMSYSVNSPSFDPINVCDSLMKNTDEFTDIGIGAFVWNEKAVQIILKELRNRNFKGRIILGGPQISYVKDNHEKYYKEADIFVNDFRVEYKKFSILKFY